MQTINFNPRGTSKTQRLSDATRNLAADYLTGRHQSRLKECGFQIADLNLPSDYPPILCHGEIARLTARKSRLEILPEERLAGSAPNIEACRHRVPGSDRYSISHTTVDFEDAVRLGLSGLEKEIQASMLHAGKEEKEFYEALLMVIDAMRSWNNRYLSAYRELMNGTEEKAHKENIRKIIDNLSRVPENAPSSFAEALQSFWSFFEFQRLCGNWSGLGRFDWILGNYLKKDLSSGKITLDEARELIAHFWIKGTEWCYGLRRNTTNNPGSGDAQNYQNIILGGLDPHGETVENEVTYLVLDVVEELHISDYPITVRLNSKTSDRLLRRIAEVQLLGGGIVSVYHEDVVLAGLRKLGYPEEEALAFTNDGCWEVIIPGKTHFGYMPQDALIPFQEALFAQETPRSFEELYQSFLAKFTALIEKVRIQIIEREYAPCAAPDAVLSLLMPSCRRKGRSYSCFGAEYIVRAIHLAGLPDVANSLRAISEIVFNRKRVSISELVEILRNDWEGHEALRLECANSIPYYGNDDPLADAMLKRVFDDCTGIAGKVEKVRDVIVPVGVSTFGREIAFAPQRMATPFGKHAHAYLAPNLSPTPGTDKSPVSALLNSYCKMDFTRTPNGCPLDLRLSAGIHKIPESPEILMQLLKVFLKKEGFYLQIDIVDPEMLRKAQQQPDDFPNLVVRISGWSARFASLSKEWQDMIINRTESEMR